MRLLKPIALTVALFALGVVISSSLSDASDIDSATGKVKSREEFAKYREAAWAHFRKRCRDNAGEKIYRTVEGVEGILLARPRQKPSEFDLRDQYWMGDPYGLVLYPPAEIARYLNYLDERGIPTKKKAARQGFNYLIVQQPDGLYLQYRLDASKENLTVAPVDNLSSRYSVTWRDISTDEDRKYWVAGGQLWVTDLETGELLGERTGFVFDAGFGSTSGGRRPWLIAQRNACPPIERNIANDRLFVERVLRPIGKVNHGQ